MHKLRALAYIKECKNMKIPQNKMYYLNTELRAVYVSTRKWLQAPKQTISNIKALQSWGRHWTANSDFLILFHLINSYFSNTSTEFSS